MNQQLVKSVFLEARKLRGSDREAYLVSACGLDTELRVEVISLLDSDTDDLFLDTRLLQSAAQSLAAGYTSHAGAPVDHPERIGSYVIHAVLGAGGMGVVYLAEQEHPRRQVALKVLRSGLASATIMRRFEHEALMLARLNHVGIAQIHEAGTADSGHGLQPYIAMEFIKGRALTSSVETLDTRGRVVLFLKVCEAVQHAHHNGVIHRDLKPANILVNTEGEPKVLDFGVARLIAVDDAATMHTEPGMLVGTLNYMSPEQAAGGPDPLDARSDVYTLGVILYELLSGSRPYEVDALAIPEAARVINQQDPTPLSVHKHLLRGDLETISAKAMEKDRSRRYQSVAALAEDLRRYLSDEPIVARPATSMYQLRKFARRNKVLVGGAAAVIFVLAAGMIATTTQTVVAIEQRNRAEEAERLAATRLADAKRAGERARTEADTTNAILEFLNSRLLGSADPENSRGRNITIREALDRTAAVVGSAFGDRPEIEAAIRQTLGNSYRSLGEYGSARTQLEASVALWRRERGETDLSTLNALRSLADLERAEVRWAEAVAILEPVVATLQRVGGFESRQTLSAKSLLASVYGDQKRLGDATRLMREVYEIECRILQPEDGELLTTKSNLAAIYREMGDLAKAELLWKEVYETQFRQTGEDTPSALTTLSNLGVIASHQGRNAEAAEIFARVLEGKRRMQGANHTDTLFALVNLGSALGNLTRFEEGDKMLSTAIEGLIAAIGEDNPQVGHAMLLRAQPLNRSGRFADAAPIAGRAAEILRATVGPEDDRTLLAIHSQAVALHEIGDLDKAEALFLEIAEIDRRQKNTGLRALHVHAGLGEVRATQGKYEEAESLLTESLDALHKLEPKSAGTTAHFMAALASVYAKQGRLAEADSLFAETVEVCLTAVGQERLTGRALAKCGAHFHATGRPEQAEAAWLEAHAMMSLAWGGAHPVVQEIAANLCGLYGELGRGPEAAIWRTK